MQKQYGGIFPCLRWLEKICAALSLAASETQFAWTHLLGGQRRGNHGQNDKNHENEKRSCYGHGYLVRHQLSRQSRFATNGWKHAPNERLRKVDPASTDLTIGPILGIGSCNKQQIVEGCMR